MPFYAEGREQMMLGQLPGNVYARRPGRRGAPAGVLRISWPRRARYQFLAAASLVSVLALAAPQVAATVTTPDAVAGPSLSAAAPPLSQVRGSVAYLESAYHVTQAEAMRRLVEQREMPKLTAYLARRFPALYAGARLDQAHGGSIVIEATQPADLAATLHALPGWVRTRPARAKFSLRALQQIAGRATARLGAGYTVTIDQVANRVVARPLAAAQSRSLSAALAGPLAADASSGGLVVAASATIGLYPNDGCNPNSCGPPLSSGCDGTNCTPPFRAGLNLDLWTGTGTGSPSGLFEGRCTSGFDMVGSNGWVYSTSAGHCFKGLVSADSNNGTWVGYLPPHVGYPWAPVITQGYLSYTYPYDFAIMPFVVLGGVNYAFYWLYGQTMNRVYAAGNALFPITGMYTYAQIGIGWVVCASGEFTGTGCGQVIGEDGGIITNICQYQGDSGAPLYSQIDNTAYGLSSMDNTGGDSCPSGYQSYFTPISNVIGPKGDGVTISLATS
jgi:streptogrisin C